MKFALCRALFAVLIASFAASAPTPAPAPTKAPAAPKTGKRDIFRLSEVKAGQKGYGLSVFQGTRIERFDIEVISIMRKFLPKQDIILIRMDHPVIREAGIIAGMSGSPVYIDGRVAGAVAYGFPFAKQAIAGVTPIENMIEEIHRPVRGPERTPLAAANRPFLPWLDRLPLPAAPSAGMQRVSLPLSAAGFPESVMGDIERFFLPWRMQPMQGGGAGDGEGGPRHFAPGGALGAQLVRGDMSLVGTGTVSYIDGKRVAAFGHPLFEAGEIYLPIVAADIHVVVPSLMRSFKLSSPLRTLGSLIQDRQAAVVGEEGKIAEMIPIRMQVALPNEPPRVFSADVVRHRILTPGLAALVALSGVRQAAADIADVIVVVRGRIHMKNHEPLDLETRAFSRTGIDANIIAGSRPIMALAALLGNRFEPVRVDRLDLEVAADYRSDFSEIEEIRLPTDEVDPGEHIEAQIVVRRYGGRDETVRVPLEIPRAFAGQSLKIVAASGSIVEPDRAPPETLNDLIVWLSKEYPADSIVLSIYTPGEGVALRGTIAPDLPTSVLEVLRPAASSRRGLSQKSSIRVVIPHKRVVFGRAEVDFKVRKEVLR